MICLDIYTVFDASKHLTMGDVLRPWYGYHFEILNEPLQFEIGFFKFLCVKL